MFISVEISSALKYTIETPNVISIFLFKNHLRSDYYIFHTVDLD